MDSQPTETRTDAGTVETFVDRREGDFWLNAVIGAVLTVVLSFVPVSPILGGGVAGYLNRGTRTTGAKVGAASGLIAALPFFAVFSLLFGGIGFGALAGGSGAGFVIFLAIMAFAVVVTALFAGGMGAVGGYLGVVARERIDTGRDGDRYEPPDPTLDAESGPAR
ncbi:MAG: DUF5518 domain-containing protein [Haloarculaceae archaeon]